MMTLWEVRPPRTDLPSAVGVLRRSARISDAAVLVSGLRLLRRHDESLPEHPECFVVT
jgi:hypothetical protein